jgi:hypothetical protein
VRHRVEDTGVMTNPITVANLPSPAIITMAQQAIQKVIGQMLD